MDHLQNFNSLTDQQASKELQRCCGSTQWSQAMARSRPFKDKSVVLASADRIWQNLSRVDWLEAFSHHPKIGDVESLREKFAATKEWAEKEQSGAASASEETLKTLAAANQSYEKRFGYIFIVCATGKSAEEILAILTKRIENDRQSELLIAADEQRKIMRLRLEKLLSP